MTTEDDQARTGFLANWPCTLLRAGHSPVRTVVVCGVTAVAVLVVALAPGRQATPRDPTSAQGAATGPPPAGTASAPTTTQCTNVEPPPSDTEVSTVLDRERGTLLFSYANPTDGVDREFTIDYRADTTCRSDPKLARLIDHAIQAATSGDEAGPGEGEVQADMSGTPACRGTELRIVAVDQEGAGGHLGTFISVENVGEAMCTLSGTPELTALAGASARSRIAAEDGTFFDQWTGRFARPRSSRASWRS